jgi:hypothetical protein
MSTWCPSPQVAPPGTESRAGGTCFVPQLDTPRRPLPDQLTKGGVQRVTRGQVLAAVGGNEQNGGVRQPPAKEVQQVKGRLIGPLDVLHDHYVQRSPFADLAQQGPEQLFASSAGAAQVQQLTAEPLSEVKQRPERPRGEKAVARPQDQPASGRSH